MIGASVLPSWFELHQIAGSGEGATQHRGRCAPIQAGLCQQSRQPPKADCPEREADVSCRFKNFTNRYELFHLKCSCFLKVAAGNRLENREGVETNSTERPGKRTRDHQPTEG